jgi:hypothetical protein
MAAKWYVIGAIVLASCAGCSQQQPAGSGIQSMLTSSRTEVVLGRWSTTGLSYPPIGLGSDGAMWCGHFPYSELQLQSVVRDLSAKHQTIEFVVCLANPADRPTTDFYAEVSRFRDKVDGALAGGARAKVYVEMYSPLQ